jgi:glycosyltransferase involved in cell wall biosynthesis
MSEFIRANGMASRVRLLGKIGDVSGALAASDVFVLSSDWEGNPLAVMEAMAAGLPVVATDVGGVPELVRHATDGLLVHAGKWEAFAQGMTALMQNPEQRRAMANAAQERACREFRVERMVRRYADLYQETLLRNANLTCGPVPGLTAV